MADTRGIRAGRAFVELGVSDKLSAGLKAAQKKLEAFGAGLRSIGTKMAGIGVAAVTALLGTVKAFSDSGDALDKMSQRTGVSVEALSELGYAADLSGTDMETLENGLRVMQKSLVEAAKGSQGANEALGLLGLTVADLAKLSPDEQFKLLADRISKVQDPALRASLAMELFGKAGTKLLPLMADGAAGINEMQEQARKLGLTVSTETARDAAELNDALGTLWKVLKQGVFTIGGALAPTIKELTERITRVIVSATAWIKENKDLVVWALKVAAAVAVAGIAIIALGYIISGIGAALGLVAGIIGGIGTAFGLIGAAIGAILSPIGLVIAAIVALGGVLVVASGVGGEALTWLGEQFTALREWVSKVVGGIADALAAGDISLAAEILWLSLKVIWQQGVAALNKAWLGAKEFFVSTAYSMWYGALAAAEIVFHALEVSWIETTAFLSKTWTNFTTGFQQVWESASLWVAKPPHGQNPSAELSFIVLDSSRGRGAVHLRARPAHPHGVCAYTPRTNGDAKMTVNKFLVAVIVLFMHCFTALTASAQPQPTPWDADDPVNKAQTRQYLSLIWQAEINGQQVDLSQFEFSNDLPEVMGLLVGPQKEVFEKLYSHRLDPHGLQGLPYGLNELLRDDATVRAQFREFVLTDKITLGPDADPEAANKHLLMIMDGIFAQAEFTVEAFQVIGQDVESTKLEVVKTPGTITPPVIPPTSPDQFKCDIDWWTLRSFFLCMTGDGLYIPENNLDPSDPNWPKKRRPVPRFDCDDFSDAMIQWLLRRLEAIYGPGSVTAENLIFAWQCPDNSTTPPGWHKPIGHAMPLIQKDGKFYLIDPFTGKAYGPFNTREEAYKKALELFMRCEGGRPVGNPDYWVPGYRPGWEPKPWWTDWEMQKHFCERLKACCGSSLVPPGENLPTCPPSTTPGGVAPTVLTPCNFRDYMPPGTFVDPRANCDH